MSARSLWVGVAGYWLAAATILVALGTGPVTSWPVGAAAGGGTAVGLALFLVFARRLPGASLPPSLAAVIVASAAAEEVVWRRLVMVELGQHAPSAAALLGSALLFAFAHRTLRLSQVAAGAAFGSLYLSTGGLLAPACAHAAYNLAVAATASDRARRACAAA